MFRKSYADRVYSKLRKYGISPSTLDPDIDLYDMERRRPNFDTIDILIHKGGQTTFSTLLGGASREGITWTESLGTDTRRITIGKGGVGSNPYDDLLLNFTKALQEGHRQWIDASDQFNRLLFEDPDIWETFNQHSVLLASDEVKQSAYRLGCMVADSVPLEWARGVFTQELNIQVAKLNDTQNAA